MVQGFIAEEWDQGRPEAAARYVDPAYEVPGVGRGPAAVAENVAAFGTAFPDLRLEVVETLADRAAGAVRMRLTGTHRGPFRGHGHRGAAGEVVARREVPPDPLDEGLVDNHPVSPHP